jgi:hypothetical protein
MFDTRENQLVTQSSSATYEKFAYGEWHIDLNAVDKQLKGKEFKQEACHMCLQVRVETDPSDRTQMRLTVASQDPNATYEYVYFPYLLVL